MYDENLRDGRGDFSIGMWDHDGSLLGPENAGKMH